MTRPAATRRERGMTLVELLVAMTLLGMLAIMMMGGLRFGARAWERVGDTSEQINAVVRTHAFLRARLSGAARADSIKGEAERIEFTALWMTALGGGGYYAFELTRRDDALVLAWRPAPDADGEAAEPPGALTGERMLLEGVSGLEITFFGQPSGYSKPEWIDRWEPGWIAPQLVRIEAELADPRKSWPTLTVGLPG